MSEVPRLIIGCVLLAAGVSKAFRPEPFARIVSSLGFGYRALPQILARVIPAVELLCGVALLLNVWRSAAAYVAAFMFLSFAVVLAVNLLRGNSKLSCGCFGGFSHAGDIDWPLVLRNGGLVVIAMGISQSMPSVYSIVGLAVVVLGIGISYVGKSNTRRPSTPDLRASV
jgi:uncharacterized membrane protein YphA (DoxX/SURF4 family)